MVAVVEVRLLYVERLQGAPDVDLFHPCPEEVILSCVLHERGTSSRFSIDRRRGYGTAAGEERVQQNERTTAVV